jgi:hypothetical protein
MRYRTRSLTWQGQAFHFECLQSQGPTSEPTQWSVSRGREFIGMMPCSVEVSTKDFDVRCFRWLTELLSLAERRH